MTEEDDRLSAGVLSAGSLHFLSPCAPVDNASNTRRASGVRDLHEAPTDCPWDCPNSFSLYQLPPLPLKVQTFPEVTRDPPSFFVNLFWIHTLKTIHGVPHGMKIVWRRDRDDGHMAPALEEPSPGYTFTLSKSIY